MQRHELLVTPSCLPAHGHGAKPAVEVMADRDSLVKVHRAAALHFTERARQFLPDLGARRPVEMLASAPSLRPAQVEGAGPPSVIALKDCAFVTSAPITH